MKIKEMCVEFLVDLYSKFFKTKKTNEQRKFIEKLIYMFIATGIAKGLLFIMNVAGGRILGPETYGEYTLIVSVTSFLMIPIGLGILGGVVKTLAETNNFERRKKIISTSNNYFLLTLVFFTIVYLAFYKQISIIAELGVNLVFLTILLMFFWSIYVLFEILLQGLHEQNRLSVNTMIAYISGFIIFVALYFFNQLNILFLYVPTVLIYIIFILVTTKFFLKFQSFKIFDKKEFKKIFHYGIYVFIITLATTFLGNIDRVMINAFHGAEAVGIYQSYFFSSIMIIGILTGIFLRIFFPTAVKLKNPRSILKKLDKLNMFTVPITLLFVPALIYIVMLLYNYQYNLTTALLFTIVTGIDVLVVMYAALLNAQGVQSIKTTTTGIIISFLINIPMNYFLIPLLGINGAIISTGVSFAALFIWIRANLGRLTRSSKKKS